MRFLSRRPKRLRMGDLVQVEIGLGIDVVLVFSYALEEANGSYVARLEVPR